jgi:5-hydroxyisourate hydrolase-like protein (transthyretin family)
MHGVPRLTVVACALVPVLLLSHDGLAGNAPFAGGAISGTVTDAATGAPLAGIVVSLSTFDQSWTTSAVSGADGAYLAASLSPGWYLLRATAPAGYVDQRYSACDFPHCGGLAVEVTEGATTGGIDFALRRGGVIRGTITDGVNGWPLAGVTVRVVSSNSHEEVATTSDSAGVYVSPTVPVDSYFVIALASPGYVDQFYPAVSSCTIGCNWMALATPVPVTAGHTTTAIDFAMVRGGVITGIVRAAATGAPVPGVEVRVYGSTAFSGGELWSAVTDINGVFRTGADLPTGSYTVRTVATPTYLGQQFSGINCGNGCPWSLATTVSVTQSLTTPGIDFSLVRSATITGTVLSAEGLPLANAQISVQRASGETMECCSRTNTEGAFSTTAPLPPGTYYAWAAAPGHLSQVYGGVDFGVEVSSPPLGNPIVVGDGGTAAGINFRLARSAAIRGAVVDAATDLPLHGQLVSVHSEAGHHIGETVTMPDGTYLTDFPLQAGSYFVQARTWFGHSLYLGEIYHGITCAPGACPPVTSGQPVVLTAGATSGAINFRLTRGRTISGQLSSAERGLLYPEDTATVTIYGLDGQPIGSTTSGAGGYYSVSGLAAGKYYVAVSSSLRFRDQIYPFITCNLACPDVTSGSLVDVSQGADRTDIDFSLADIFSDRPLTPRSAVVKALHIAELRLAIERLRAQRSLPTVAWTDPVIVPRVTTVKAVHVRELWTALLDAYAGSGIGIGVPSIVGGQTTITASTIQDLRCGVALLWPGQSGTTRPGCW